MAAGRRDALPMGVTPAVCIMGPLHPALAFRELSMFRRHVLALICLLAGTATHADTYRCVIDGRTTFRDKPCLPGEQQSTTGDSRPTMDKCYAVEMAGIEGGRQTELMRIDGSDGRYTMSSVQPGGSKPAVVPMRRATSAELRDAARLLKLEVTDAIVMVVPAGTPNQPAIPIGFYQWRDAHRDPVFFFYGFFSSGPAKPVPCP